MPSHPFVPPRGRLEHFEISSELLGANLLGDPAVRRVAVYVTEGADEAPGGVPLLVDLVGFTGSGMSHIAWKCYEETVPQRVDRLLADGKIGPCVVALPDCFTSLGGNQYITSVAMGPWADYLIEELIPALEARFPIRPGRDHRACFGKSSGGYGSMIHGMRYADTWAAIACHSGDMGFDRIYMRDFVAACDALAKHGGIEGFLAHFEKSEKVSGGYLHVMMVLAMAATYDPDPQAPSGVRLPVDHRTCALDPEAWSRWLAHDPVQLIEDGSVQDNLRSLRGLYIDCGASDQYFIHYGSRQLVGRLEDLGIAHRYDEFEGTHSGINYRMDESLPFLYAALTS
jgi:S-formylglutathione hydrolase FrmB